MTVFPQLSQNLIIVALRYVINVIIGTAIASPESENPIANMNPRKRRPVPIWNGRQYLFFRSTSELTKKTRKELTPRTIHVAKKIGNTRPRLLIVSIVICLTG